MRRLLEAACPAGDPDVTFPRERLTSLGLAVYLGACGLALVWFLIASGAALYAHVNRPEPAPTPYRDFRPDIGICHRLDLTTKEFSRCVMDAAHRKDLMQAGETE